MVIIIQRHLEILIKVDNNCKFCLNFFYSLLTYVFLKIVDIHVLCHLITYRRRQHGYVYLVDNYIVIHDVSHQHIVIGIVS